jgi:hypothetical protein
MIGKKFQTEWVPIPMLRCPFCGGKAELRRFFLSAKAKSIRWLNPEVAVGHFPEKRHTTINRIDVGCFNLKCLVLPLVSEDWMGDPDFAPDIHQNTIKAKNKWNKRTKRKDMK